MTLSFFRKHRLALGFALVIAAAIFGPLGALKIMASGPNTYASSAYGTAIPSATVVYDAVSGKYQDSSAAYPVRTLGAPKGIAALYQGISISPSTSAILSPNTATNFLDICNDSASAVVYLNLSGAAAVANQGVPIAPDTCKRWAATDGALPTGNISAISSSGGISGSVAAQ